MERRAPPADMVYIEYKPEHQPGPGRSGSPWGSPIRAGPASGLTFIAAATDRYFRAFDTQTGKELWRVSLPVAGQSMPMTYRLDSNSRQYVVLSAGGPFRASEQAGRLCHRLCVALGGNDGEFGAG